MPRGKQQAHQSRNERPDRQRSQQLDPSRNEPESHRRGRSSSSVPPASDIGFQNSNFHAPVGVGTSGEADRVIRKFAKAHSVDDAAFNSRRLQHEPLCLPDTRVALLDEIMRWADTPSGACMFWLNGMAGTGKSTIARTVAQEWAKKERLGASFFFSRGQGDLARASKFFTTLAYQLATAESGLAAGVRRAICDHPDVPRQNLRNQWERLILEPLSQLNESSSDPAESMILVIDALDECDYSKDTRLILDLLSQARSLNSFRLRVFVTSRPETPICRGFDDISQGAHRDFILHQISCQTADYDIVNRDSVNHDISTLLRDEFDRIRKHHHLPKDWPDEPSVGRLIHKADGLFIYASTICLFIGHQDYHPPQRLALVLEDSMGDRSSTKELDLIYTTVIQHAVVDGRDAETKKMLLERFRRIVGSIVILSDALTATALCKLLGTEQWEMEQTLRSLSSVLAYSESEDIPIRLLHPSFRDFLLDDQRCSDLRFCIVAHSTHMELAVSCIEMMSSCLKQDICSLKLPGVLNNEVDRGDLERCIPQELRYACRYWVGHLKRSNVALDEGNSPLHDRVHTFLKEHFLHWLEALSLMGNISDGVLMVKTFESMLTDHANHHLLEMARDAVRFVLCYRSVLEIAPLQGYSSALAFSPMRSVLRKQFWNCVPGWISNPPVVPEVWDSTLQVLEGHRDVVRAAVFSPDGKLLASASNDNTIRLWDPMTGNCHGTLEGHWDIVSAIAFSPDSKLLASASNDATIRLWGLATGTCHGALEGHRDWVNAVSYSPDGKILASASDDGTIRLWDPMTGTCYSTLEGHWGIVSAIAFSPDSKLLASASNDATIRLWGPATGTCHGALEGHRDWVNAVSHPPDGKLLASASYDETIRLWDAMTGICHGTLEGHQEGVSTVLFSPDGKLLASASNDATIRLWCPTTGACHGTLEGHQDCITAITFLPDGRLLASASHDATIRLWNPMTGACYITFEGHCGSVTAIAFSPDSKLLASASQDTTIRLWNPTTGACHSTLAGHWDSISAIAFPPDGKLLTSASYDTTIRLWDPMTGIYRTTLEGHWKRVTAISFSLDGKLLASASHDKTIRLWDPTTGICRSTLEGHHGWVTAIAFLPYGKLLASASNDKTIRLWDPTTGICHKTLEGHRNAVTTIAFSPNGKLLASASRDGTIRLWDPTTGACRSTLEGHWDWVIEMSFSLDGKRLEFRSPDGKTQFRCNGVGEEDQTVYTTESIECELPTDSPHTLCVGDSWVYYRMKRLFWLHSDYRGACFAARNNIVAFGHGSGRVTIMGFDLDKVPSV